MRKDLKKYYRDIARALPPEGRKTLLSGIRSGVASYLAENPQATLEDVAAYVGTPECIANDYYANQDGRKITRKINASRRRLTVFSVLVLAALALFIGFLLFELAKSVL